MKINLEELESIPELAFSFNEAISELNNNCPVTGKITVSSKDYGVEIKGQVETDIILECDRCLKNFKYHINLDIDEKFVKDSLISETEMKLS